VSLPNWPPRDWRALLALCASIGGAAALHGFAAWTVWILWRGGWPMSTATARIMLLGKALLLSVIGNLVVLVSLGLAINRREIKVSRQGFEMSGGDTPDPVPTPSEVQP
jgi:hypothetical protein